jgi:hypothetical protein
VGIGISQCRCIRKAGYPSYGEKLFIFANNGDNTFTSLLTLTVDNSLGRIVVTDFDGDGDNDIAVANRYSGNISVFENLSTEASPTIPMLNQLGLVITVTLLIGSGLYLMRRRRGFREI